MMLVITAAALIVMMGAGFLQYRMEPARVKARRNRLHTFLVDPPTMLIVGLLVAMFGMCTRKGFKLTWSRLTRAQFDTRRKWVNRLLYGFLGAFFLFAELPAFIDLIPWPGHPERTGGDFMMNGYIEPLLGHPIYHGPFPLYQQWWAWLLLAATLVLQFACLRFGRALGYQTAYFNDPDNWSDKKPDGSG